MECPDKASRHTCCPQHPGVVAEQFLLAAHRFHQDRIHVLHITAIDNEIRAERESFSSISSVSTARCGPRFESMPNYYKRLCKI